MIETENIMTAALSEALETMAFLTIMPMDDDAVEPQNTVLSEISFTGPQNGTIQILADLSFCETLAENIAAMDEADDEISHDALKELANVVCGLTLTTIAVSPADEFDMSIPAIKSGNDSPKWSDFTAEQNSFVSNVEGYLVAAKLIVKN